jgi:hypothetical protein
MNLEWYMALRRAFLPLDLPDDDEARDETTWTPDPGDMVLGYRITVTEDGGAPHLAGDRPDAACPRCGSSGLGTEIAAGQEFISCGNPACTWSES